MAKRRRPAAVTWLAVLVLVLGAANLLGAYGLLARWPVLAGLELTISPWGLLIPALAWGIGWLVLAWGLWRLAAWARPAVIIAFPLYELMLIGRQAVFARGEFARGRLPIAAAVALLLSALVAVILTRPGIRRAFARRVTTDEETETR